MRKYKDKIKKRIESAAAYFDTTVYATAKRIRKDPKFNSVPQSKIIPMVVSETIAELEKKVADDHDQWHRWFAANKKRQAQVRSIRRLGHKYMTHDLRRVAIK